MRDTVETSALVEHRAKVVVPKRIIQMEEASKNREFPAFAALTCADCNQFHADACIWPYDLQSCNI